MLHAGFTLRPLHDRVVVRRIEAFARTRGVISVPDSEAMQKVGNEGVIAIKEAKTAETNTDLRLQRPRTYQRADAAELKPTPISLGKKFDQSVDSETLTVPERHLAVQAATNLDMIKPWLRTRRSRSGDSRNGTPMLTLNKPRCAGPYPDRDIACQEALEPAFLEHAKSLTPENIVETAGGKLAPVLLGLTKRAEAAGWMLEEAEVAISELAQNLLDDMASM
jgi:hypothetical protein